MLSVNTSTAVVWKGNSKKLQHSIVHSSGIGVEFFVSENEYILVERVILEPSLQLSGIHATLQETLIVPMIPKAAKFDGIQTVLLGFGNKRRRKEMSG